MEELIDKVKLGVYTIAMVGHVAAVLIFVALALRACGRKNPLPWDMVQCQVQDCHSFPSPCYPQVPTN